MRVKEFMFDIFVKIKFVHGWGGYPPHGRRYTFERFDIWYLTNDGNYIPKKSYLEAGYNDVTNEIIIVWQNRLLVTALFFLHELGHWFLHKICRMSQESIHAKYDFITGDIHKLFKVDG